MTANPSSLAAYGGVEAHIAVVCAGDHPNELVDAGITSSERASVAGSLQLVDGQCRFSRLRLLGTTSTFGGRMFHFVVSLVKRDGNNLKALASMISACFAVYSRKNADKKRKAIDKTALETGRWSEGYSFVPFEPKELSRKFVKKVTNSEGQRIVEEITNSWLGLLNYMDAPNIRFKVRHPLFLAIRFSNVLVILRDALRFPDENEEALRSFICSCGFPLNCVRDPAVAIPGGFLPPWLIAFRSSNNECPPAVRQKLERFMNVVKGPALGFVPDDSLVPQRYQPTFNVESLGQLYSKLYALEFASKLSDFDKSQANGNKRSRYNDEDHGDGLSKTEPEILQETGDDQTVESSSANGSGTSHGTAHAEMRQAFESYFNSLHAELRMLLEKVVDSATSAVGSGSPDDVVNLQRAYQDFTEALSVHAYVEEHVLFSKRAPQHVVESYNFDHRKENDRILEIANIMQSLDSSKLAEAFLKIAQLSAVHNVHMEKEEEYYWPLLLQNLDDAEIAQLISQSKSTIAQARVNLNNSRHKAAIDQARLAVGLPSLDDDYEEEKVTREPPDHHHDDAIQLIEKMF